MPNDVEIIQRRLSRRHALAAGLLAGAAASLPLRANAAAPAPRSQVPAWYRFRVGDAVCTVVSDGPLPLGEPAAGFPAAPAAELTGLLESHFLPTDAIVLPQNCLVVHTGNRVVLFDTGLGASSIFGPTTGDLLANLAASGIGRADIDAVVITHAHCDHCWGLVDGMGSPWFPNAEIFISQADFDFWTDESKLGDPSFVGLFVKGARDNLLPLRERITFVADGQEILPGVQAIATPGHTIGHTSFVITSGGQTLVNIGDLAHHHVILLQRPKWEFAYDTDPAQSARSRFDFLTRAADEGLHLLGYHFPFPGLGHVAKAGEGFAYHPTPMGHAFDL